MYSSAACLPRTLLEMTRVRLGRTFFGARLSSSHLTSSRRLTVRCLMNSENLSKLSELAIQYGPFFFSILFMLGVMRWAYRVFKETSTRTNPAASPRDLSTVRLVFLGTFFFGLMLVVVSVVWWLGFRPKIYAYQGQIIDLQEYETLVPASENVYFRTEPKESIDGIPLRNEHFLIVQNSPISKGQSFDIEFSKNKSKRNRFSIVYDPSDLAPKFRVDWDDNLHTNVLHHEKQTSAQAHLFSWTVHAADPQTQIPLSEGKAPTEHAQMMQKSRPAQVLQDSGSDVGAKIIALDEVNRMPASALTAASEPGHEPLLATLLDLTRYSDKEVSYKAAEALKKVNLDDYIVRKLQSPDKRDQADAEKVLLKLGEPDTTRILARIRPAKAAELRARAWQSNAYQVVPTASPQGDRYYVKATWDPANAKTVDCLTVLFNSQLISNRSLEQERALMKNRNTRLVYWYDKDWSVNIAKKIQSCGGNSTFVQAGYMK